MARTPLRVFPTAEQMGEHLAARLLDEIEAARDSGMPFLLGCPTGRTPRPVYRAMARRLAAAPQDLSHLVAVMMDEYLVSSGKGFAYVLWSKEWSCHRFARTEIAGPLNAGLNDERRLRKDSIWFPDPRDPESYDKRIADAGGIDFFILASGATDGHVAFNPPGSPRESRTRIIPLSEETRRDNLKTFPSFGTLDAVPTHGISVGIDTIVSAKECAMLVSGAGKRLTLERMTKAGQYDPNWPATVIHECAAREILADADAASALDGL
ncbi:MAG TPA: 6-phosphogluconolactonase [Gemmatimonadaceae bacterium]